MEEIQRKGAKTQGEEKEEGDLSHTKPIFPPSSLWCLVLVSCLCGNFFSSSEIPVPSRLKMRLRRQRRPYLLLELMIAFFLVSLCSLPLIHSPLRLVRAEIAALQNMELSRKAECAFASVKEDLYNHTITWEMLPKELKQTVSHKESVVSFKEKDLGVREWRETKFLTLEATCEGTNQEEVRKISVKIVYEPLKDSGKDKKSFVYRILAKHVKS